MVRSEWKSGAWFAECAEALSINTDQVLAMFPKDDFMFVWYTAPESTSEDVYMAVFTRDEDNILVIEDVKPQPGFLAKMKQEVEEKLREELGDPDE